MVGALKKMRLAVVSDVGTVRPKSNRTLTVFALRPVVYRAAVTQESRQDRETRAAVKTRRVTARSPLVVRYFSAETRRQVARFLVEYDPLDDAGERTVGRRFLARQYGGTTGRTKNNNRVIVAVRTGARDALVAYGTPPTYNGSSRFNSTSGELERLVVTFPSFS